MRTVAALSMTAVLVLGAPADARAQAQTPASAAVSVPRLITITGTYQPASGQPAPASAVITLAVYAEPTDGAPLFQETQDVALDPNGRYVVQLGATQPDGLPLALFADTQERWLGVQFAGPGETEHPRTRLTSVPYALRAADADTLGGHPASAYVLAPKDAKGDAATTDTANGSATTNGVQTGTLNMLAKYVNTTDVGDSGVFENNGLVGIGTTGPIDALHVRFANTTGTMTGYAVQNLGNTAASYSGMLFYDQNNALGQFQGFNNVTHEYRINNVAKNGASQFNGSINFMLGGVSKFLVAPTGNIGIGTTSPSALLEVSNALTGVPSNVWVTSYTNAVGPYYLARRSRGTGAAPTAAQNGDGLSGLFGQGYGTTQFGPGNGSIVIQAAQNFTDTQQGTAITFSTTPINSTTSATRMTLDATGNLGIGTTTTPAAGILEVSNAASTLPFGNIFASSYTGTSAGGSLFIGRKARGTAAAPVSVLNGDNLAGFLAVGYGATSFSGTRGGMFVQAAENWTDISQGTRVLFNTTATGTITPSPKMAIDPSGNVGIGTTNPGTSLEIVRNGETTIVGTSYNDNDGSAVFFQRARGTQLAPTAVLAGDALGYFGAGGYGATSWGNSAGAMAVVAMENWTDTANGNAVAFATTPLGTTDFVPQVAILPNGSVGIGTPGDSNGIPTATDKLQVFGDVRVGTSGTNGCVKNFAGTQLTGTCVSDRRYKKGITPFGPALDRVAALQPVHFYWRADEFPDQHFGDSQAYGLIAQDVERVLPELVVTREDGYKAIDYSKLPLLTIQAIKELKAENDDLRKRIAEIDELKQRIADLERLLKDLRQPPVSR
jgi:hypothetical protein